MQPTHEHARRPDVRFDGGDLDCGNGLLLLIRKHIDPLDAGGLLEILSTEDSVEVDLPSWCRMTGHALLSWTKSGSQRSYLIQKAGAAFGTQPTTPASTQAPRPQPVIARAAPKIPPLAVQGIGSWPRPRWLREAIHARLSQRMDETTFAEIADDAVRLAVQAQIEAGADLISDGEQRRDSYASFVGHLLEGAALVPLTDLSAMVDEPEKFAAELRALDVPAAEVRHPVAFGRLRRSKPLALQEAEFVARLTDKPRKVALPGPYLLTRTMWLDCLRDRAYERREDLADDLVRILREELQDLLTSGVALVQFDEPVLTEVVFTPRRAGRSFMCGALSEKGAAEDELRFANELLRRVTTGFPADRLAVHICRGNWTKDEGALLAGDYRPLKTYLQQAPVGTLCLELSTPRAGELQDLLDLKLPQHLGFGLVNPRSDTLESPATLDARLRPALDSFGPTRLLLNPDCGFATFADNPVASRDLASQKLQSLAALRSRHLPH